MNTRTAFSFVLVATLSAVVLAQPGHADTLPSKSATSRGFERHGIQDNSVVVGSLRDLPMIQGNGPRTMRNR